MHQIPKHLIEAVLKEGQKCYPEEACGFLSGNRDDDGHVDEIHPMENQMDHYHQQDPKAYPRTNRNAYLFDAKAQLKLERSLRKQGKRPKVIYHSHPDVGAYFSSKDREDALWNGQPRYPGVDYLVCGITDGQPDGAILVSYNTDTNDFDTRELMAPRQK